MKTRNILSLLFFLLVITLGWLFFFSFSSLRAPSQLYPATVHRDCAPWDGSAFTVQIPWQNGTVIDISIWQSPEINFPKTFSFPDNSAQIGNAILILPVGNPQSLSGTVSFSSANTSAPLQGRFDLQDEAGSFYKGTFQAVWQELMVLCG